jgi:hypothetical protein
MSLEQAITDHASALRELAAAIRGTISTANNITAATDKVISTAKTTAAATSAAKEVAQGDDAKKPAATPAAAGSKSEAGPASSSTAPTYDDVKAKVLALSKDKGRDQVVALLQRHGVEKAPELKPEQYADIIADADRIIAGEFDAIAGEPA